MTGTDTQKGGAIPISQDVVALLRFEQQLDTVHPIVDQLQNRSHLSAGALQRMRCIPFSVVNFWQTLIVECNRHERSLWGRSTTIMAAHEAVSVEYEAERRLNGTP